MDTDLEALRGIASRADTHGVVRLKSAEVPFALLHGGWIAPCELGTLRYHLTDHGRALLGLPRVP